MGLIFFGLGFGLLIGTGLFFLVIWPALRERREEQRLEQLEIDNRASEDKSDE